MKKILVLPLLLISICLSEAPIGEKMARQIATDFFQAHATRSSQPTLNLEWAGDSFAERGSTRISANSDNELLYIYNRTDAKGFVIVAGDSNVERAIVAFSHNHSFDIDNLPSGAEYMLSGWCRQIADARIKPSKTSRTTPILEVGATELHLETALWNQGQPFNNEAPIIDGYRSVTGCVATAMSIICYYNRWPEKGYGTTPAYNYTDANNITHTIPANTLGRTYNYSLMRKDYNSGYTQIQGNAVAALMKDMGTSVAMMYHPTGSGAFTEDVPAALHNYFRYSDKAQLLRRNQYDYKEWESMLKTNIASYGPTYLSGASTEGGHAFVTDGYTSDGYFSINYGWGGTSNGYYLLPDITYTYDLDAIFYLEPDRNKTSSSKSFLEILPLVSGSTYLRGLYSTGIEYNTGESFHITIAGLYNTGPEAFNGSVRINVCNSKGEIKETLCETTISNLEPFNGSNFWYKLNIPVTITKPIEYGDRLRIYCKEEGATEWRWVKYKYADGSANNEIIIKATPKEVARGLMIQYQKEPRYLFFQPNSYAVSVYIYDASNKQIGMSATLSNDFVTLDLTTLPPGEYRVEFKCSGEPYVLTLVL